MIKMTNLMGIGGPVVAHRSALSDLPGQTRPLAICLVPEKDTNVSTEIGFATFTLVQLNGKNSDEQSADINGQTQPAMVTVASGGQVQIAVPGCSVTGNVLIGNDIPLS